MCIEALGTNTSQLNQIDISDYNRPFGNTTQTSISSGVIVGTAVMLEGLSARICKDLGFENATVVLTGGCASYVVPGITTDVIYDPQLVSRGLRAIFEYNREGEDE
jgi:type III pantothenate kinase